MQKTLYALERTVDAPNHVIGGGLAMRMSGPIASTLGCLWFLSVLSCNTLAPREVSPESVERANCVNQCKDETEPAPVDCAAAEEGVEFYPIPVWNFQRSSPASTTLPKASNLYMYADGSQEFIRSVERRDPETGELVWYEQEAAGVPWRKTFGFEPNVRTDVARCIGEDEASRGVLHVQGGPFRAWGGAVGRHLKCINRTENDMYGPSDFSITGNESGTPDSLNKGCGQGLQDEAASLRACTPPTASEDPALAAARYSACPQRDRDGATPPPEERFLLGMTLDLTQWDGISFWARRSNDAQPGIRLAFGDKYTDDDLSYLQYHLNPEDKRFCERNQECGCLGGAECVNGACYDPRVEPPPSPEGQLVEGTTYYQLDEENDYRYSPCGQYMCERGFPAFRGAGGTDPREDAAFGGTTCQEFTFRGGITDYFCSDPETGRLPHENSRLCGDHWLKAVHLTPEWKFYKIPFTDLAQQGWAQESFQIDLTTAAVIRFIWGRGWIDLMLDDVRFYRNKNTKG